MFLRQSTSQAIRFGQFLDKTDGVTEEAALTITQADMRLSKNGGAFAQKNAAGNATHDSNGWYSTTLDTTDTNTVGELILSVSQPANTVPVWVRWYVLPQVIFDALFASTAAAFDANQRVDIGSWLGTTVATPTVGGVPEVDVTHMAGGTQTVTDLKDFADSGYDPLTKKVQGVVLVDTTTTNTDMRGTDNAALASVCTEARLSELDAATSGKMANQVDVIEADTTSLNDTKIPDVLSLANINAEVDSALNTAIPASPTASSINEVLQRLARSVGVVQEFTIDNTTFTATTTQAQVDAVDIGALESTDDHYKGRIIIFTTGALAYQATGITAYDGLNKRFTYDLLTEAPADNDKFLVV